MKQSQIACIDLTSAASSHTGTVGGGVHLRSWFPVGVEGLLGPNIQHSSINSISAILWCWVEV